MGILADFFIGDDALAKAMRDTSCLPDDEKLEAKNIMELHLGYLYQISESKEASFDDDLGFETVNVVDEGEQVTTKIPADFVDILANADDHDLEA